MLKVLRKEDSFIAFEKDAGIVMHEGDAPSDSPTFLDLLLAENYPLTAHEMYPLQKKEIDLHGLVNRLDRDTSGVVLVALTQDALTGLRHDFTHGLITKTYLARAHGHVKEEMTITSPLGREKKGFRRLIEGSGNARGPYVSAETHIKPLSYESDDDTSLLLLTPRTGRTHQLRAHLASIGHPIVGDILYGTEKDKKEGRLYLHAHSLKLRDGTDIISPCPWQESL